MRYEESMMREVLVHLLAKSLFTDSGCLLLFWLHICKSSPLSTTSLVLWRSEGSLKAFLGGSPTLLASGLSLLLLPPDSKTPLLWGSAGGGARMSLGMLKVIRTAVPSLLGLGEWQITYVWTSSTSFYSKESHWKIGPHLCWLTAKKANCLPFLAFLYSL